MPPLRSSSRKKKHKAESPVASPPPKKKKATKLKKPALPKTPPCSSKALSALAVRASPRLKALEKKGPILPTKEARSRANVVKVV
jgi:hypothetical protein